MIMGEWVVEGGKLVIIRGGGGGSVCKLAH